LVSDPRWIAVKAAQEKAEKAEQAVKFKVEQAEAGKNDSFVSFVSVLC